MPVEVVGYNEKTGRFVVQQKPGKEKEVVRLSIMFNDENPIAFKERVELAKLRQKNAAIEQFFEQYINAMPAEQISQQSEEAKKRIFQKARSAKRFSTVKSSSQTQTSQA